MYPPTHHRRRIDGGVPASRDVHGSSSLLGSLWRRRWTVGASVGVSLFLAGLYLAFATRVFSASAVVLVEQKAPDPLGDTQVVGQQRSDMYVQTQADVLQSASVLKRALDAINYRSTKTFAKVGEDPISWLRRGGEFKVDVARKSDVILVSMESPWPEEAAAFANSVVKEYIAELAIRKREMGGRMLTVLEKEREDLKRKRDECTEAMLRFKRDSGVLSFGTDRGNTALDRVATLSTSLTAAEMTTIGLRSQLNAIKRAMQDEGGLSAYVEAQQFKTRNTGDHEYDELRSQLIGLMLALTTHAASEGPNNSRVMALESMVSAMRARVTEKEQAIARAHLAEAAIELAAAEENERVLRESMLAQRAQLMNVDPQAFEYAKLEADVARIQKLSDILDTRIGQVTVNEFSGPPLNVQFVEQARIERKPVKPNILVILAASLMLGGIVGGWIALTQEWRDTRFRNPQEIHSFLGTSVLATVPRINVRLSPIERGQTVFLDTHSPSAEAYRGVRTSLHLGPHREARTILLASATPGEGKSTTASNLAIAFAQAGQRTLLIDCDMRQPVQHLIFENDGSIGASSVVAGEQKLAAAIQQTRVPGLYLLPSGPKPANPSELLASKRFGCLMRSVAGTFNRIVIDSPPLMTASDARIIAASVDATLLVLRIQQSTRQTVIHAMEDLDRVGAKLLGAIANDMPALRTSGYYRGSWRPATSAKRILASLEPDSQVRGHGECALSITEPEWPSEDAPRANGKKLEGWGIREW